MKTEPIEHLLAFAAVGLAPKEYRGQPVFLKDKDEEKVLVTWPFIYKVKIFPILVTAALYQVLYKGEIIKSFALAISQVPSVFVE